MSLKNLIYAASALFIIFAVSGCETVPKKFREEVSGIKTRVDTLSSRLEGVEMKQQDIERATGEQAQTIEELKSKREKYVRTNIGTRSKVSRSKGHTKEIQLCLKNAGFYDGEIDGIKGKGTRKAIREFQEAKGLTSDGVVGPRTWKLLSKYASGAAQDSAGTEEEGTK